MTDYQVYFAFCEIIPVWCNKIHSFTIKPAKRANCMFLNGNSNDMPYYENIINPGRTRRLISVRQSAWIWISKIIRIFSSPSMNKYYKATPPVVLCSLCFTCQFFKSSAIMATKLKMRTMEVCSSVALHWCDLTTVYYHDPFCPQSFFEPKESMMLKRKVIGIDVMPSKTYFLWDKFIFCSLSVELYHLQRKRLTLSLPWIRKQA